MGKREPLVGKGTDDRPAFDTMTHQVEHAVTQGINQLLSRLDWVDQITPPSLLTKKGDYPKLGLDT